MLEGFNVTVLCCRLHQPSGPVQPSTFKVPPLLCTNAGTVAVGIHQVYQLVPRNKDYDPRRVAL